MNIQHGGGARAERIAHWLLQQSPDIVLLQEWRENQAGQKIKDTLEKKGFKTASVHGGDPHRNGLSVCSRDPPKLTRVTPEDSPTGALGLVEFGDLYVCAAYFPHGRRYKEHKERFFRRCFDLAEQYDDRPFLLVGDLNTGRPDRDSESGGFRFKCSDLFDGLVAEAGLSDLWRRHHGPDAREWTWRSTKNGFRIDHALANAVLLSRSSEIACRYLHEPREMAPRMTDHSALVVENLAG